MCRNVQTTLGINLRTGHIRPRTHLNLPTAPQTKDRVTVVGVEHQVVRVETIEQANTPITYVLYLRV